MTARNICIHVCIQEYILWVPIVLSIDSSFIWGCENLSQNCLPLIKIYFSGVNSLGWNCGLNLDNYCNLDNSCFS
jgi:hypothetical protein